MINLAAVSKLDALQISYAKIKYVFLKNLSTYAQTFYAHLGNTVKMECVNSSYLQAFAKMDSSSVQLAV